MDFVTLIDRFGEPQTAALLGVLLGLVFGFAAQRSGFCTRSAVLDLVRNRKLTALSIWLVGLSVAVLGMQWLIFAGSVDVAETRFFATAQSLSGAIAGGSLFGLGMILTRGCASRLLVLGASGNLRALFTIAIVGATAWATYQGPLVPLRDAVAGLWSTAQIGGNDGFGSALGGTLYGIGIGVALLVLAVAVALRARPSLPLLAGGAAVGLSVVAGWYYSFQLSTQVFEPIQAESLSFMRPLANIINFAASAGSADYLSMDIGLFAGTVAGALFAAVASRSFSIAGFGEPGTPHILRYAGGAVLMGFGGILAVGCTIGAGFTGGAVLATSAIVALASMIGSAAIADVLIDQRSTRITHSKAGSAARLATAP